MGNVGWMARTGAFSHTGHAGSSAHTRIQATGFGGFSTGENIYPGKPSSAAPWHGCERFHFLPDGNVGA